MNQIHPLTKLIHGVLVLSSDMATRFTAGWDNNLTGFCDIHLWAISQGESKLLFCITQLNVILLKSLPHLQEANDLR